MNLFTIENLLISILCLTLTIIIFRYAQNLTHRIWGVFNFIVAIFSFNMFLIGITTDTNQALWYWRFTYTTVPFIGVIFYHFVSSFCNRNRKLILLLIYAHATFFSILSIRTNFISSTYLSIYSIYYHDITLLFNIWFFSWLFIVSLAFFEFFQFLKKSNGTQKVKTQFMFWSMLIGFLGGTSTILPAYGIKIYPGWQISIAVYVLITSYAIFKHDLLPINQVIKRSLVYSLLVTIIFLIYLTGVILFEEFFHKFIGYKNIASSLISSIIIAIIFIPLKNLIQSFIEKTIFHGSYTQIAEQNKLLRQEIIQSEKLKSISTLASGMAHEIKNPLTVLKTFSEYLPQKLEDKDFLKKFAPMITQEINRIDNLVHELLYFAKPAPPVLKPVLIQDVLTNTLEFLNNEFIKHNIKVQQSSYVTINTKLSLDHNQIKQAFLNIFLNAIDAMPTGGELNIITSLSLENKKIHIKIQDTGAGIDPHDLPYIFDPFFSKKDSGTGLGLSITHEIIKKHGGKILVESLKDKGSTFILELPL